MRGDEFKRGAVGKDDISEEGDSRFCPTPPSGRDKARMFWESIGMKPGDDWKAEAESIPKRGGENES
jgi:hypothetical protein